MRKRILTGATIMAVAAISVGLQSCGGGEATATRSDKIATVENFSVSETLKSAERNYKVFTENDFTDSCYLTLTANVQWPENLGGTKIAALQDSIIMKAFGSNPGGIDRAMADFVDNPDAQLPGNSQLVDSIPLDADGTRCYSVLTAVRVLDLDTRMITLQTLSSSYLGGAHPNTYTSAFTYDIEGGEMLTYSTIFRTGTDEAVTTAVRNELAVNYNVSPTNLSDAGFFGNDVPLSQDVYIHDGMITFHYNPYEVGPYSMGAVDVAISPYIVRDLLTPRAAALLLD